MKLQSLELNNEVKKAIVCSVAPGMRNRADDYDLCESRGSGARFKSLSDLDVREAYRKSIDFSLMSRGALSACRKRA